MHEYTLIQIIKNLIDDMHCADEGVTKHLLKLWFLSRYNKCEFYLLYRSQVSYPLIFILKDKFLHVKYYNHLIKYILFLRIIRQDFVSKMNLDIAQLLINSCVDSFQALYGTKNTTHNLHSNLHLPEQLAKHGNKCNVQVKTVLSN